MALRKTRKTGFKALLVVFEKRNAIIDISGVTPQSINTWQKNNKVPICRRPPLIAAAEKRGWLLTNEQLRGDIKCVI